MDHNEPRTEFERRISRELRASAPEWTPDCLSADDLLRLAGGDASDADIQRMHSHAATCAYCRREYVKLRRALWEADQLRATPPVSIPHSLTAQTSSASTPNEPLSQAVVHNTRQAPPQTQAQASSVSTFWWRIPSRPRALIGYALAAACAFLLAYAGTIRPLQNQVGHLRQAQSVALAVPELKAQLQRERTAHQQEAQQNEKRLMEIQTQANKQAAVMAAQTREFQVKAQAAQEEIGRLKRLADSRSDRLLAPADEATLQADAKQMKLLAAQNHFAGGDHFANLIEIIGLQPAQTLIETLRPRLHWQSVSNAAVYKISLAAVLPDGTLGDFALQDKETTETDLPLPTDLKYGQVYEWQIDAYKAGETKPFATGTARFALLDSLSLVKLAPFHLRLGDVYAKSGLVENARREWQAIPPNSVHYHEAQKRLGNINVSPFHNP